MITAQEALARLQAGNQRFVADVCDVHTLMSQLQRGELVAGQAPFAIVLGCSDSRLPAESVFDQGVGAEYSLETGVVDFFDGLPKAGG